MQTVEFRNICKTFDGNLILQNVNLIIEKNKINVLIGRSGSGKSTLLKMINALVVPTEGELHVLGKNITEYDVNELRIHTGYSVQGASLFPHLNVFENISIVAKLRKMNAELINERVNHLLKLTGLKKEYLTKYPYKLSGGEQQRVGLCRAIMLKPEIILLDEPFGALDVTTKNEIHSELIKIQSEEPSTILLVTHDLNEALKLADKIIILENGIIQQEGTKDEILSNPANEFVKNFIQNRIH